MAKRKKARLNPVQRALRSLQGLPEKARWRQARPRPGPPPQASQGPQGPREMDDVVSRWRAEDAARRRDEERQRRELDLRLQEERRQREEEEWGRLQEQWRQRRQERRERPLLARVVKQMEAIEYFLHNVAFKVSEQFDLLNREIRSLAQVEQKRREAESRLGTVRMMEDRR